MWDVTRSEEENKTDSWRGKGIEQSKIKQNFIVTRAPQRSQYVAADAGCLCEKAAVLPSETKETRCIIYGLYIQIVQTAITSQLHKFLQITCGLKGRQTEAMCVSLAAPAGVSAADKDFV